MAFDFPRGELGPYLSTCRWAILHFVGRIIGIFGLRLLKGWRELLTTKSIY